MKAIGEKVQGWLSGLRYVASRNAQLNRANHLAAPATCFFHKHHQPYTMTNRNLYLTYKKDTSRLLYWVINTSNGIVGSVANAQDCAPVTVNTSGQSSVSEIVNMSKLIAQYVQPIPATIFKLFEAVIRARSETYEAFRQIVNQQPDPEVEKSNETHKFFIEALTEAFDALGGSQWAASQGSTTDAQDDDQDMDMPTFQNRFAMLGLNTEKGDSDSDVSSENDAHHAQANAAKKKITRKGKKGKRKKKSKQKPVPKPTGAADVPIESYRIIEDKDGLVSEYLLAVYAVAVEWSELRSFIQNQWHEVAYGSLNGAVAASLTHVAVNMVRQTCNAVFVDFPGHETYETIVKTLTRGDPNKAQGQFSMSLYRTSSCGHETEKVEETAVDVKEQFWVHAYNDLVAFVTDFQKNRTGKPTKAMQAQINNWDPNFDLQNATIEERLSWRRSYTINWLYDLVNVFSSIVVQRNTMKGEQHIYETVDWSPSGPWHQHRRLYGLNEFAGVVTSLAMQKPNTDIRDKILPHHVFQLQCIVDSLTASRGWILSPLRGHVLESPAPDFRPRRDVDLFLDRELDKPGQGFLQAVDVLTQVLGKEGAQQNDINRHKELSAILEEIKDDFVNWLGESKYMYGLKTIPPSRFSKHNANGLWEFSPLLCAAGLAEALILAQRITMLLWDRIPEPTLAVHLHNMLVEKGYLKQPVGLYATLQSLLKESFFVGNVPNSRFYDALVKRVQVRSNHASLIQRQALARDLNKDVHQLLDVSLNAFFNTKSSLMMYHDADWMPERIPDRDIKIPSVFFMLRMSETGQVIDPASGETRLNETELVKRAKALGQSDEVLLRTASVRNPNKTAENTTAPPQSMDASKDYTLGPKMDPYSVKEKRRESFKGRDFLDFIRFDLYSDICGTYPLSSFNYAWITVNMMMLFMTIEDKFRDARHPLYVKAYENSPASMSRKRRAAFIMAAMADEDKAAMELFAEVFDSLRLGALNCIFWEDLDDGIPRKAPKADDDEIPLDECLVM